MRQSRYLLWFNELSKNRRIQSSFVSRKWRSWVSRFFTYCLINQTQTQWDFCVVGLYNLGLYWKKNSKVYAYKWSRFSEFFSICSMKIPIKIFKITIFYNLCSTSNPEVSFSNFHNEKWKKLLKYLLWAFNRHVKSEAFYWYIFSYTDSTMYIWYCLVFIYIIWVRSTSYLSGFSKREPIILL